jgi:hypothetical protein
MKVYRIPIRLCPSMIRNRHPRQLDCGTYSTLGWCRCSLPSESLDTHLYVVSNAKIEKGRVL